MKILIKFFEWLYFEDGHYKIVKIKGLNTFIVDKMSRHNIPMSRSIASPVWDWGRFKYLLMRLKKGLIAKLNLSLYIPKNPYKARFIPPGFFIRSTILKCFGYVVAFALGYAIFWLCWALLAMEGL